MEKKNVYQIVTDKIIDLLDKGVVPWHRPWRAAGFTMPISVTGHRYRGINVFLLGAAAVDKSYTSPIWMTYKNANELGGGIKPDEKATLVVFWKIMRFQDKNDMNEVVEKKVPLLRYYNVFNYEQTGGVKLPKKMQAIQDASVMPLAGEVEEDARIEDAENIINGYIGTWTDAASKDEHDGPLVRSAQGAEAMYQPRTDIITIANKVDFESIDSYYATLFHECGHSTGHKERLNRTAIEGFDHFGSGQYAEEELVAEMTSAFLCGESNINSQVEQNAAYIKNWRQKLTADPKLIVQVAGKAQKAADLIVGRKFEQES